VSARNALDSKQNFYRAFLLLDVKNQAPNIRLSLRSILQFGLLSFNNQGRPWVSLTPGKTPSMSRPRHKQLSSNVPGANSGIVSLSSSCTETSPSAYPRSSHREKTALNNGYLQPWSLSLPVLLLSSDVGSVFALGNPVSGLMEGL